MTIALQSLQVRHETRVRLVFTVNLASGAFGNPAPANYTVANVDGTASDLSVLAALMIPSSPNVVELVLDGPLAKTALYEISATGIPGSDSTTVASGTPLRLRWGLTSVKQNVEQPVSHRDLILYFIDIVWNGEDFQKTATGDLDRISGPQNVKKALNRRIEADDLPWDGNYGAKAREYIDSPSTTAGTLRGNVASQILQDPRVSAVKVDYEISDETTSLFATPTLISGQNTDRLEIEIPNDR